MKKIALFLALASIISVSSYAQTTNTVYWNFSTGGVTPSSGLFTGLVTPTVVQGNNNGTTPLLTQTSVSSGYTTAAGFTASGTTNFGAAVLPGAFSTSASTYLEFSISLSPSAGNNYELTDISFGSRQTGTGPQLLSLYESTDDFTSDFTSLGSLTVPNTSAWAAHDFTGISISLPDDSSTTSFRIYASGVVGSPAAGTATWRVDDLSFTVATPEPSSVALAAIGGITGFFMLRRKA